jgi:hypothetical protein
LNTTWNFARWSVEQGSFNTKCRDYFSETINILKFFFFHQKAIPEHLSAQFVTRKIGEKTECDTSEPPTNNSAYLGNEIDCYLVDHKWLLNTEKQ